MKKIFASLWPALLALGIFVGMSVMVQLNIDALQSLIADSAWGMPLYVFSIMALVSIPFANSIALVPLASALWGWQVAGVLTLVAWLLSSIVVFEVVRRFGAGILRELVPPKKLKKILRFMESAGVPGMILLRAFLSSDVSVYILALFTRITRLQFFLISVAGLAGPAFVYAYVGGLDVVWQIGAVLIGISLFFLYLTIRRLWHSKILPLDASAPPYPNGV